MSHLLAMSVGPVQELIAAARRTRDLWFGSYLLSEVSRAVANVAEALGGTLIFPASADPEEAENVANVVLVELRADADPRDVAARARKGAQDRWSEFAEEARRAASGVIRDDIWGDQAGDVIEFYAAWVTRSLDYPADRARVMRLLAGRKGCRDFLPARGRAGVPKSSLDGQRESVLRPPADWPAHSRARLRVREGEQLDVIGLVKRVAGGTRPYPSVARVAADPWVRGNRRQLGAVIDACERLGNQVIRRLSTAVFPQYTAFPYEGTAVFTTRHHDLEQETGSLPGELRPLQAALAGLPEPDPYLAILVADGDKMGAVISGLNSTQQHLAFSRALAGFASHARKVVADHNGTLVYAGGDDVLAFVPVDTCLACARQLHDRFAETLKAYGPLTLSVGIAIAHFMESLEDLLGYGRAAEKRAKAPDRDGLAISLHKRGGAPIGIRAKWTEDPDQRIARYAQLFLAEAIPGKLPYDLRGLADVYEDWPAETVEVAIRQDVIRLIHVKQPRSGRQHMPEIVRALQDRVTGATSLHRFAEDLLVARQLAGARRQAEGRPARIAEVAS